MYFHRYLYGDVDHPISYTVVGRPKYQHTRILPSKTLAYCARHRTGVERNEIRRQGDKEIRKQLSGDPSSGENPGILLPLYQLRALYSWDGLAVRTCSYIPDSTCRERGMYVTCMHSPRVPAEEPPVLDALASSQRRAVASPSSPLRTREANLSRTGVVADNIIAQCDLFHDRRIRLQCLSYC